jgi:predicted ATPase
LLIYLSGRTAEVPRPIVMFLDDLQWADAASLDLVAALIRDCKLTHFLFIGSYRDNEVDSLHPLAEELDIMQEKGTRFLSNHIGNLHFGTTTNYIADALQLDPAEVVERALALYSKTAGNMYYTLVSLLLLEQKGILRYSCETCRWKSELQRLAMGMRPLLNWTALPPPLLGYLSSRPYLTMIMCLLATLHAQARRTPLL